MGRNDAQRSFNVHGWGIKASFPAQHADHPNGGVTTHLHFILRDEVAEAEVGLGLCWGKYEGRFISKSGSQVLHLRGR